jgi:hypothetical protein
MNNYQFGKVQYTICEGEGDVKPLEGETKPIIPPTAFNQDQVNKFLADEKRKWQVQQSKTIQELTDIKNRLTTSDEEKADLNKKIEEMQTQLLSKEELAEREKKKIESESKVKIDSLSDELSNYKNQYTTYRIKNEITQEAVEQEAFSPAQVVALLQNDTRLVQVVGEDKKPTGDYSAVVAVRSVKDGKPVNLQLSIKDALKRMKETPAEFGNLFKSTMAGGVGGGNLPGSPGSLKASDFKDPADYRKNRAALTS